MNEKFVVKKCGDFSFACRGWSTSRAWGHEVFLLDGWHECGRARVRYYNRTWECYTFQSAMFEAVDDYEKHELERYLNNRKIELGFKGFDKEWNEFEKAWPKGLKAQEIERFKETKTGREIKQLREFVEKGKA